MTGLARATLTSDACHIPQNTAEGYLVRLEQRARRVVMSSPHRQRKRP